jgi:hypothetical protein
MGHDGLLQSYFYFCFTDLNVLQMLWKHLNHSVQFKIDPVL